MSISEHLRGKRAAWQFDGRARPTFAVAPKPGQESVWDYPRPPRRQQDDREVVVRLGGHEVARSRRSVRVLETASPPTSLARRREGANRETATHHQHEERDQRAAVRRRHGWMLQRRQRDGRPPAPRQGANPVGPHEPPVDGHLKPRGEPAMAGHLKEEGREPDHGEQRGSADEQ